VDTLATQRLIAALPERVWQAFADPAQLARWWGPAGFRNEFEVCDFREGGDWRFTMVGPDGARHANQSRFLTLEPARRLVVAVNAPHFTLTVTLAAEGAGTRLHWAQRFASAALCAQLAGVCGPANEQNLDRLAAVCRSSG
jgi:uncharacterized protein YndB with AHSA1/START domain